MSFLKREYAPLTSEAWAQIDEAARRALTTSLKARRIVDVTDPRGWEYSALGLGRLELAESSPVEGVDYGIRLVQPLVETRARCELDIWELDNFSRGAVDVNLTPLEEAARRAASFEDRALFLGMERARIRGLDQTEAHPSIPISHDPDGFLDAVTSGILALRRASVSGPFALVLGAESYLFLASAPTGYPLLKQVQNLVEGPVLESDLLRGGLLLSLRGGDFHLYLGEDFGVGYETHDTRTVRLFIAESFTFRIVEPRAVLRFTFGG